MPSSHRTCGAYRRRVFEHITNNDCFSLTLQRQSLMVAERPALTGPGYDSAAIGRTDVLDHDYRHVSYAVLKNLKDIVCKNPLYPLDDQQMTDWTLRLALHQQHEAALPFSFNEMDDDVMTTLGIAKPVSSLLEIINIDDAYTTRVGWVTPTVVTLLDHRSSSTEPRCRQQRQRLDARKGRSSKTRLRYGRRLVHHRRKTIQTPAVRVMPKPPVRWPNPLVRKSRIQNRRKRL